MHNLWKFSIYVLWTARIAGQKWGTVQYAANYFGGKVHCWVWFCSQLQQYDLRVNLIKLNECKIDLCGRRKLAKQREKEFISAVCDKLKSWPQGKQQQNVFCVLVGTQFSPGSQHQTLSIRSGSELDTVRLRCKLRFFYYCTAVKTMCMLHNGW